METYETGLNACKNDEERRAYRVAHAADVPATDSSNKRLDTLRTFLRGQVK